MPMAEADSPDHRRRAGKPVVLALLVTAAAVGYWRFRGVLTLDHLADRESVLRDYQLNHPAITLALVFGIYVAVTGLSLPFAAVLTLVCGWFFGFWQALLIVSFASTAGSTVAFLCSRFLLQDTVRSRLGDYLERFDEALQREGAFYLFSLRLVPFIPFWIINLVMGLTPLRTATFWWVSQVGMLPGTAVYVYAGANFPTARELADNGVKGVLNPELVVAFTLLGTFPLLAKWLMARIRPARPSEASENR